MDKKTPLDPGIANVYDQVFHIYRYIASKLMNEFKAIGIMSGSSLDGLDICATSLKHEDKRWTYTILEATTLPFPDDLLGKLETVRKLTGLELTLLDLQLGDWMGEVVDDFIKKNHLDIDVIGSHGHTVFHQVASHLSLQIGNGHAIARKTQLPVVTDFRQQNVLYGGQGAPLVPIGDLLLFEDYVGFINLGGIANVSLKKENHIVGGDIVPCNQVLNRLANQLDLVYDAGGKLASQGNLNLTWLKKLGIPSFYDNPLPRSIANEWVEENYLQSFPKIPIADALYTYSVFVAKELSRHFTGNQKIKVLLTGGGAYNKTLVELIRKESPNHEFIVPENRIVDFKEALIFGLMAVLKMQAIPNVLSHYTGANIDLISGVVYNP